MRFETFRRFAVGAAFAVVATAASAAPSVIYSNDFDGNVTTAGGQSVTLNFAGAGNVPMNSVGGFSGNALNNQTSGNPASMTTLTLSNIAAHNSIDINFLLAFLDSWDGQGTSNPVGDYLGLFIDGTQVATLSVYNYDYDATAPLYAGATFVYRGNVNNAFAGIDDRIVDASTIGALNFAHTASTLTFGIQAYGPGWQGGSDESWAIDNLSVTANLVSATPGVPEPATWAMMVGGFGLIGGAMRRRAKAAIRFA